MNDYIYINGKFYRLHGVRHISVHKPHVKTDDTVMITTQLESEPRSNAFKLALNIRINDLLSDDNQERLENMIRFIRDTKVKDIDNIYSPIIKIGYEYEILNRAGDVIRSGRHDASGLLFMSSVLMDISEDDSLKYINIASTSNHTTISIQPESSYGIREFVRGGKNTFRLTKIIIGSIGNDRYGQSFNIDDNRPKFDNHHTVQYDHCINEIHCSHDNRIQDMYRKHPKQQETHVVNTDAHVIKEIELDSSYSYTFSYDICQVTLETYFEINNVITTQSNTVIDALHDNMFNEEPSTNDDDIDDESNVPTELDDESVEEPSESELPDDELEEPIEDDDTHSEMPDTDL